ncbi:MAG: rhodanese-like domain-containing protein [Acetobacteraceae bacterium]
MKGREIDARELRAWHLDGAELAVLDAREEGEFGRAHLFWAVPCPLTEANWRVPRVLPRRGVRVALTDGGGGEAAKLAGALAGLGYGDVSTLQGGVEAWRAAGFALFGGVNVPSKAFGEWVEHEYAPESIEPLELKRWQEAGTAMAVLDVRTFEEFRRTNIPGAISVPGGELVYRIGDLAPDPDTVVVVNCAGRTRSILGAESLRQAGIPNRVVALRNGTMGWELAGFACEMGAARRYPGRTPATAVLARERAEDFARRAGVVLIDRARLRELRADAGRTLYLLDVRSPEEYRAGHVAGSLSAPGGQLVQASDRWIAVRGARLALIDDAGARACMTGGWLRQMGQREVYVVEGALKERLETGPEPRDEAPEVPLVTVAELKVWLSERGTLLIDCARSTAYRAGHIPGAVWAVASRLEEEPGGALAEARRVVVTAADGWFARHGAAAIGRTSESAVRALDGGTAAWIEAGEAVVATPDDPPDGRCIDVHLRPYDRTLGVRDAMRAYLDWEVGLREQIAREGTVLFSRRGPRGQA